MYELKTQQNKYEYDEMTQPFLNILLLLHNCLNGKNLHIVMFIHVFYS